MICLKGCSKEIEMLNELLTTQIHDKTKCEVDHYDALKKERDRIKSLETVNQECKALIAEKEDIINQHLLPKIKKLECELLKFNKPEVVKGIGTYYNDPVSGEPLFSPDFATDVKPEKKRKSEKR